MRKMYLSALTVPRIVIWRWRLIACLRILCGCLCAADACYRWLAIEHGRLPLVLGWLSFGHPHLFAVLGAGVETLIACCLLCGVLTKLACGLGILLTLLGYTTTGALGTALRPGSFDLGILFVVVLIFLGLALGDASEVYGMEGFTFKSPLLQQANPRFSTARLPFLSSRHQHEKPVIHPEPKRIICD
ncbi:MAG: hypothetical protein H0U76_11055 [Ktedonobacteraceae bacterium]|nr:hypothetical protein [Ktedonobacteraceae bacterium]